MIDDLRRKKEKVFMELANGTCRVDDGVELGILVVVVVVVVVAVEPRR